MKRRVRSKLALMLALSMAFTTLPNGQDAMSFVRINRIWNDLDNVNLIDVTIKRRQNLSLHLCYPGFLHHRHPDDSRFADCPASGHYLRTTG